MTIKILIALLLLITNVSYAEKLPNILLLISDDQRFDQNAFMPRVMKNIAAKGITYNQAYVTTPLCCPSRSGIYTGQYNSRNKVLGNNFPLLGNTIYKDLAEQYYQGIIGKYLNSHDGSPLPEFDYWAVYPYGNVRYQRQLFNVNGTLKKFRGHIDERIGKFSKDFFKEAFNQPDPWFLTCAFFSPHAPAIADDRDLGRFDSVPLLNRPNYKHQALDKPTYLKSEKFDQQATSIFAKRQREAIYSMDRTIGKILRELKDHNQLENTLIIFLSDNGVMHGEHGLTSKVVPYEESIKVPIFLRYDPLINANSKFNHLVANIDLAPTIYDLTKVSPKHQMDGLSLLPTFLTDEPIRQNLLIESWKNNWKNRESFYALHTGNELLINNDQDISEFYDLRIDPYQMTNFYTNLLYAERISNLQTELNNLVISTRGALDFNLPEATKIKTKEE